MVLALTLQWHLGSMHMEGSWLKRASKIFITQWHPERRHRSVRWRRRSAFLSPRPLVFIMYLLFPSVRLFFAVWRCQGKRVFFPLPWLYVCTDGCQEGQTVYCFRPCGMPAVMDGLGRGFSSGLRVPLSLQVQSVRSLAAMSNHTLISLDQKQGSHRRRVSHNISVKIRLSADVGHPGSAVTMWGVRS